MTIRFHNTLTRRTEDFTPQEPGRVTMYTCGPTVYDFAHIGNFRTFLAADVVRRFLQVSGLVVDHVMNITDVGHMVDDAVADGSGEDKMATAGARLKEAKKSGTVAEGAVANPDDPFQVAEFYAQAFIEDGRRLGLGVCFDAADRMPRATHNIDGMIRMIERLIEREHAYVGGDGVVYYSVESFDRYGELSGNSLDELREGSGGRISAEDQANKRHPADFMLWKPDPSHIMKWDSPWGAGYPGWHLECSVMSMEGLGGETIDIHTGGEDLVFPHHECEIAQSCGATGRGTFARTWLHSRFLMVEGEKMSKSKGTFFTVRDVLEGRATDGKPVSPAVLRYELIKGHYRSNANFTAQGLRDSAGAVRKLRDFEQRMSEAAGGAAAAAEVDPSHPVLAEFLAALGEDLNMSAALGVVFPWMSGDHPDPAESLGVFRRINHVLAVAPMVDPRDRLIEAADAADGAADPGQAEADGLCAELDAARAAKDFDRADAVRAELVEKGWKVQTTKGGSTAMRELG